MSFSDDMNRLQQIVGSLERGGQTLEESLATFEEGVELVRSCRAYLEETKRRVTMLTSGAQQTADGDER